ncbi:hypothetical protein JST97_34985 [bacterium]|nr:hypothetical protein [bacterium]
MNPIQGSPLQPALNTAATQSNASVPSGLSEIVDKADPGEVGDLPSSVSELRRAHPWLNPSQLGNLMLNQTGQNTTYHQVQALRPSYQTGHFDRLGTL